jgi:nucleotide-binding universal stress UspA family protein
MTMRYQVAPGSLRVAGRILFGVDGWDGSHRALSWAIAEARVRGSLVQAVTVWRSPYDSDEMEDLWVELGPDRAERIETVENERLAARARAHSEATLAAVAGSDPPAKIEPTVVRGDPASTLCELSGGADLLVVGTRGHGGFAGLVLG